MQIKPPFIIISAENSSNTEEENKKQTESLSTYLKYVGGGLTFMQVEGVYKNTKEVSFIVRPENERDALALKYLARSFKQGSILSVDVTGDATLHWLDKNGKTVRLGKWTEVGKETAEEREAYTSFDGRYFITKD